MSRPELLNHPSNANLYEYVLGYVTTVDGVENEELEERRYARFFAESREHAKEQLDCEVEADGESVLFYEVIKKEK